MFKYTARKEILRDYFKWESDYVRYSGLSYSYGCTLAGSKSAFFAVGDFWKHYVGFEFYSLTRRKELPLNGVLVPAGIFEVSVV